MIHFVRTSVSMRIAVEKIRKYKKMVCIENGWWEDAYPLSTPYGFDPGHKLQKPSKESGIFQSLGTIRLELFLLTENQN